MLKAAFRSPLMACIIGLGTILFSACSHATTLKEGNTAPTFSAKDHTGADFALSSRKGSWTVLFFYPKAGTPGCTKQACAFRDNIKKIREQGAEVFGISTDSIEAQAAFHKEHRLTFPLLSDADGRIAVLYGSKLPAISMAKRWTFIIDPELKIRAIDRDVDPVMDAQKVADRLRSFKTPK
jgi:peroxiredoxin Q/BCP